MGLYKGLAVKEFWAQNHRGEPLHPEVSNYIGRSRWEQINRFFHISDPKKDEEEIPFKKLLPLNEMLRPRFKKY